MHGSVRASGESPGATRPKVGKVESALPDEGVLIHPPHQVIAGSTARKNNA